MRAARDPVSNTGSASHYLPADGAELTFPMLQFTLLGALCMLGTLWLVVRARSSVRAAGLAIGVLAVYLWSLLSMLATLARTTLLSFRLQPTLTVLLAAAGVFGFVELTLAVAARGREHAWGRRRAAGRGVGRAGRGDRVQPGHPRRAAARPRPSPTPTPTATANAATVVRRAPRSTTAEIDAAITRATGKPRDETVVLTADYSFLSYYPYYGFQGLTSHYANPLAQFDKRAAAIESWATLTNARRSSSTRWTRCRGRRRRCS